MILFRWLLVLLVATPIVAQSQLADPFGMQVEVAGDAVRLQVDVPGNHYLYADHLKVTDAVGTEQEAIELPPAASITDPNTGEPKPVYDQPFKARYAWKPRPEGAAAVHVQYWGCNDSVCFIPQAMVVELPSATAGTTDGNVAASAGAEDWLAELGGFEVLHSAVGYLKAQPFIQFLDKAEHGGQEAGVFRLFLNDPVAFVRESGLFVTILFILVGGLALNLTPCVLPMIPINLAIIGAGAQAGSKGRGFALGAVYGLGIALVYGLLGVVVVLTGSQFGTIQSNPWFNFVIAAIFILLALAMFDVIHIDLSRFQGKLGSGPQKPGSFLVAMGMGAVAALLAGACVAPVVIAVLLLATSVGPAGLVLPFVLGIGMALPWPFAGAGLSFLPKPGRWMVMVKYGFGAGIVFFALYYGHLGYRALRPLDVADAGAAGGHVVVDGATNGGFSSVLEGARTEGKPVFIDFWASWCKNCQAMDKTTFRDEAVKARLEGYAFVKYVAEDPTDPETKAVMEYFGVQGLPTFVVLKPR